MVDKNGLKFALGDTAWAVYRNGDGRWLVKESYISGVNLDSRWCYFTDSEKGKYEHAEGELFATKQEAELAADIIQNNTGGIREVTIDEVVARMQEDHIEKPTVFWVCSKFKVSYTRAVRILEELKERTNK